MIVVRADTPGSDEQVRDPEREEAEAIMAALTPVTDEPRYTGTCNVARRGD